MGRGASKVGGSGKGAKGQKKSKKVDILKEMREGYRQGKQMGENAAESVNRVR